MSARPRSRRQHPRRPNLGPGLAPGVAEDPGAQEGEETITLLEGEELAVLQEEKRADLVLDLTRIHLGWDILFPRVTKVDVAQEEALA